MQSRNGRNESTLSGSRRDANLAGQEIAPSTSRIPGIGQASAPNMDSNLHALKARVVASLHKSRENSSTPTKEGQSANKAGNATAATDAKESFTDNNPSSQIELARKDSRSDVDDLVAEGKAAAEADRRIQREQRFNNNQGTQAHRTDQPDSRQGALSKTELENKSQKRRDENELLNKRALNGGTRESSGPSEQGEIIEDKAQTSNPPSQRRPLQETKTRNAAEGAGNKAAEQLRRAQAVANEFKVAKQAGIQSSREERRTMESNLSKKDVARPTSRTSAHPRSMQEEQNRVYTNESRAADTRRAGRSNDDIIDSLGTHSKVRPSDGMSREVVVRKEYIPRRVIEIDDSDDHRRSSVALVPVEYKEPSHRQYVEEQSRKAVIHLSDSYWTDLEEWLEMTGYHDRIYRKDALHRHRELVVLDLKRAALAREAQVAHEERAYISRAQSVHPTKEALVPSAHSTTLPHRIRSSSVFDMPPPALPTREARDIIRRVDRKDTEPIIKVRSSSGYLPGVTYRDDGLTRVRYVESPVSYSETGSTKRRYQTDTDGVENGRSEKFIRVDRHGRAVVPEEDEVPREKMRAYSSTEDIHMRDVDRLDRGPANEYVESPSEEKIYRSSREVNHREQGSSTGKPPRRSRFRTASPLPANSVGKSEVRSHRRESHDQVIFSETDQHMKKSSNDLSPTESRPSGSRAHEEGRLRFESQHTGSQHNAGADLFEKRITKKEERGTYQPRGGYGSHPYPYQPRGRGRGRGGYFHPRGDMRMYNHNDRYAHPETGSQSLDLRRGG